MKLSILPLPLFTGLLYSRLGNSGPFRHSSTDSFHSPSHSPFNAHHVPGGTAPPPIQRGGPFQDQRVGGAHSIPPQDVHMHGSHPSIGSGPPTPGISGMQQQQQPLPPQFQGM